MPAHPGRYDSLHKLATHHEQAALRELGRAQEALAGAERKFAELEGYLAQYAGTTYNGQSTSVVQATNRIRFMQRLREAVCQQAIAVRRAEERVARCRQTWLGRRQECGSFDKLNERALVERDTRERRCEQEILDEFGARPLGLAAR